MRIDIYLYWKKGTIIELTEISKNQHFNNKIINQNTSKEEKTFGYSGIEPGSPEHKPTTLTTTQREISLQDFGAQNL